MTDSAKGQPSLPALHNDDDEHGLNKSTGIWLIKKAHQMSDWHELQNLSVRKQLTVSPK
jgi:hypothetical protein